MEFKEFDAHSMTATKHAWRQDAVNSGAFLPDVEQQLDWAQSHMVLTENEVAYGIFRENSHIAAAICELVVTKKSVHAKWIKFIRLRLRPTIDAQIFSNEPAGITSAIEAYIACVIGVFKVKNTQKANTIKVYGRTQQQLQFLAALSAALSKLETVAFKSSIEGRWLVLKWK